VLVDSTLHPESAPTSGTLHGRSWQAIKGDVSLPDAPPGPDEPSSSWVNVLRYASPGQIDGDITDALRRALASGASTLYLPYGRYTISDAIDMPPSVRRIVGMNASITVRPERNPGFARTSGMFRVTQPGSPLLIDRIVFDMTNLGNQLAVEVAAARTVVLRDIVTAGTSLLHRSEASGAVFIEDVCCGALSISGPAPVYARQLDTEGGDTRIVNDGSPLTILGLKTEGDCVVLDNRNGAVSRIAGGLLYVVGDADASVPAFRNADASLRASFVEESFRAASRYTNYVVGPAGTVPVTNFPERGYGRVVPLLTAGGR
jgi:hypothetical protein